MGYPINHIDPNTKGDVTDINHCVAAQNIYNNAMNCSDLEPSIPIYIIVWSDDFEPNNCTKSSRTGVHIKTVTISAPQKNVQTGHYTFPIALGPKHGDTEKIESLFREELLSLSTNGPVSFFDGVREVNVYHIICIITEEELLCLFLLDE